MASELGHVAPPMSASLPLATSNRRNLKSATLGSWCISAIGRRSCGALGRKEAAMEPAPVRSKSAWTTPRIRRLLAVAVMVVATTLGAAACSSHHHHHRHHQNGIGWY